MDAAFLAKVKTIEIPPDEAERIIRNGQTVGYRRVSGLHRLAPENRVAVLRFLREAHGIDLDAAYKLPWLDIVAFIKAVKPAAPVGGTEAQAEAVHAYMTPAALAASFDVPVDNAKHALRTWRQAHAGGDGYIENPDARPNEPRFLFRRDTVAPVLEKLRDNRTRREIRGKKSSR